MIRKGNPALGISRVASTEPWVGQVPVRVCVSFAKLSSRSGEVTKGLTLIVGRQHWQVSPRGDDPESSQPPPTRVSCDRRTPPHAHDDSEFRVQSEEIGGTHPDAMGVEAVLGEIDASESRDGDSEDTHGR